VNVIQTEREDDYPFYKGYPVEICALKWLVPLAFVGIGSWILLSQPEVFSKGYLRLAPSMLFAIFPLVGLALVAGRHWTALFRTVGLKDVGWMFAFAVLNYVITIVAGFLVMQMIETERNAGVSGMAQMSSPDQFLFFINSIPQLIGEELITIVPFLAILYFCHSKLDFGRNSSVIIAWLLTAIWFALIHLPTYNWNLLQCLLLIGGARLVLTLAYIKTKNLWVSAGAHIINDWTTFGLAIIGASRAVAG
jgi:membrane protease YdiL (CAAX protease family)